MKENTVAKEWFKDWAIEYDRTLGKMARHHSLLNTVVRQSKVKKGDQVLDVGCGTGLLSLKFIDAADCQVTGIDNSKEMLSVFIHKIKKNHLEKTISVQLCDASALAFPDQYFDIIASTVTLHHLTDKLPAIKKMYTALKPGGRLIIGEIDLDTTGKLSDPDRLRRIMTYLIAELQFAAKDGGALALSRMYDNGKKHLLNDGEYCISTKQWGSLCKKAGFKKLTVTPSKEFAWFKVLVATK